MTWMLVTLFAKGSLVIKLKMKSIIQSLVVFVMTVQQVSAQHTVSATVKSLSDHSPVIYANVGIVGANIGTVTNPEGFFKLSFNDSLMNHSLRISLYGFEPYLVSLKDALQLSEGGNWQIQLADHVLEQEEVTVRAPELKEKELGRRSDNGFITLGFASDQLGSEMGSVIQIKRKTYVEDFNFFIATNGYDSLVFRLNFFACNEKGVPTDSMVTQSVVFAWGAVQQGAVKIDLTEEHLILRQDVLMSLEIVGGMLTEGEFERRSVMFGGKMVGGTYARQTSQSMWEEVPMITPAFYINVSQETK